MSNDDEYNKKKEYHHNYYVNHYKQIISTKKIFCECCKVEISAWNLYKHKNSKKHLYNSLSDEEKEKIIAAKQKITSEEQYVQLKKKLELLKSTIDNYEASV